MDRNTKILFRLLTPALIFILSCNQLSFVIHQSVRFVHYHYERNSNPLYKNKLRDTITLSKAEVQQLVWVKDDEIRFKERMFDVKKQLQRGDKILIIGHYDLKDDMLLSATFGFFYEHSPSGDSKNNSIKLLLFDAVLNTQTHTISHIFTLKDKDKAQTCCSFYEQLYINSTSPPPKLSCV